MSTFSILQREFESRHLLPTKSFRFSGNPCRFFKKLGFDLCKAEQPLQGMKLQEKEAQKD